MPAKASNKQKAAAQVQVQGQTLHKMQLATILSDLNSLRASDAQSARALVSARAPSANAPLPSESSSDSAADGDGSGSGKNAGLHGDLLDDYRGDADLERAFKLSRLHREVKLAYMEPGAGPAGDEEEEEEGMGSALLALREARESVRAATAQIGFDSAPTTATDNHAAAKENNKNDKSGQEDQLEDHDEELAAWS